MPTDAANRPPENPEAAAERDPRGAARWVVGGLAAAWSLFQVAVAGWWTLDSIYVRSAHLAFALALVFLLRPALRRPRRRLAALSDRARVPWFDWLLASLGAAAALYVVWDYEALALRAGSPLGRDLVAGLVLLALLFEACRRALGPALSIIALLFSLYAFFSEAPFVPGALLQKSVSLTRFLGQMTMSDEGIYGTPLRVSARTVFLFVLFGSMLDRAGGGRYFTQLALSLLGGFRGGPAKAAVLSSGLTGMASGSSIANIVTTGTFTIPLMKRIGYPPTKAAAIEVAASTDGQLAPPIMGAAAFIIAEYVGVPYLEVIKAAAVPAFASYAALLAITHLEACKLGIARIPRAELPSFRRTLTGGLHYLLPVVFLLYQLIVMRRTPEAAAFSAVWVMALVMLGQRMAQAWRRDRRPWTGIGPGLADIAAGLAGGGRNMVGVALATAGAGVIVGVVSLGLGGLITQLVEAVSMGSLYFLLLLTALACLLIGMGLPTTATYITMATLLAPVIVAIGQAHDLLVPLMAAHLFVFYFGILADDTPPVGLAAYTAAAIAKSPPIPTGIQGFLYDIRTAILPFMFILNPDLILHNVHSWPAGLGIFALACLGNCAFVAATQGWLLRPNRPWEIPLLLAVTFILMRPDQMAAWLGIDHAQRYWTVLPGLALLAAILAWQKFTTREEATRSAADAKPH